MTQQDIRMEINKFYNQLDNSFKNSTFILNKDIEIINNKIFELRKQCNHEFKDGICIWCDLPEEMANDKFIYNSLSTM